MTDHLYAVPSALLFRKWATLEQAKPSRKLLLKNGGSAPVMLKLHLPKGAPFELAGPSVQKGCAHTGAGFELLGGASTSLTVMLNRQAALPGEAQFELTVMTRAGNLHVPFVTMEQTEEPAAGQPCERRSQPTDGDELSYGAACVLGDRPLSRGKTAEQAQMLASKIAEGDITPAGCAPPRTRDVVFSAATLCCCLLAARASGAEADIKAKDAAGMRTAHSIDGLALELVQTFDPAWRVDPHHACSGGESVLAISRQRTHTICAFPALAPTSPNGTLRLVSVSGGAGIACRSCRLMVSSRPSRRVEAAWTALSTTLPTRQMRRA
eukprot:6182973-Pleurochrysis_carterae.AAC.1